MSEVEAAEKPTGKKSAGISQALLLFGVCFILVSTIGSVLQGYSFKLGLAVTLVFLLLLPAIVFVRAKGVGLAEGLRLRAVRPSILLMSVFLGLGTWGVGMLIARGLSGLGLKTLGQGLDAGLNSPASFALSFLVAAVGPGICEEVLFRGAIQGVLERRGKWFAVIVTALLFGLLHMSLGIVIPAAVLGFFYGWVVIRTGSILPAMVAHFANNAAAFSFLYFLEAEDPAWLLPCLVVVGAVAVAAIIWLSSADQETISESPLSEVPAAMPLWGSLGCLIPLMAFVVMIVGLSSALPYFIQIEKLDDGKQVVYADQDSLLYKPVMKRDDVQVLYMQGDTLVIGRLVELSEDTARVRDQEGLEIEIPTTDIKGVVLNR